MILSAEEAKRIHGDMVPLDGAPGVTNRIGFTIRVPVGVVCAITPFNSPLNTVAHKVAPALAAGNSVILKPASTTPITAALFCRLLIDAGLPAGYINLVNGAGRDVGGWLLEEERFASTRSPAAPPVGRAIQRGAGLRRTQLELGSVSSTIVCDDANLEWAAPRCVNASFRKAGQVCTSVQRLFVQEGILDRFVDQLIARTNAAKVGDPRDPATLVGPMIAEREAERAESWVNEAVAQGARVATGGRRDGAILYPTIVLERDVADARHVRGSSRRSSRLSRSIRSTMRSVRSTTRPMAWRLASSRRASAPRSRPRAELEVGTLHVNETSSSRVDLMPYGGVKDSGFGREGPEYAIREMTEERLITICETS